MIFFICLMAGFYSQFSHAQIADASFFPSVRSINPSVAHMRTSGFIALDVGKNTVNKQHDVPLGGIVGGIKTDVDLTKATLFRAGKGNGITFEALVDTESGAKTEKINSTTHGNRTNKTNASSTYYGGILDLKYFGISYAGANYNYLNKFRVGEVPNLTAKDIDTKLNYTNLKIGSAIKIRDFRLGAFLLSQKSKGNYSYTFYDPNTGNKGSTEKYPATTSAQGYGIGLGYTKPRFRIEISQERMYGNKLSISDDYPGEVSAPPPSSRLTFVGEIKFSKFAVGIRTRQIKGNYMDLENIISSNLLYSDLGANDTRLENSFNFTLGNSRGFTYSAFFTMSKVTSKELSPVFDNGIKYKAVTTSQAYGINFSYIY